MSKFFSSLLSFMLLTACAAPGGLLVSESARAVGGNLFIEDVGDDSFFLVLDGDITRDTAYFFQVMSELEDLDGLVITQSPGGDLFAAHQIGREIAEKRMNTMVIAGCFSACVDIFITGRQRLIGSEATLGLHSMEDPELGFRIDQPYWASFGFQRVNEAAYKVPFEDMWIIDAKEAKRLRLATEIIE